MYSVQMSFCFKMEARPTDSTKVESNFIAVPLQLLESRLTQQLFGGIAASARSTTTLTLLLR